ncbi:MAG: hypothetical protein ABI425_03415 [Patescibacteria group bacterium]
MAPESREVQTPEILLVQLKSLDIMVPAQKKADGSGFNLGGNFSQVADAPLRLGEEPVASLFTFQEVDKDTAFYSPRLSEMFKVQNGKFEYVVQSQTPEGNWSTDWQVLVRMLSGIEMEIKNVASKLPTKVAVLNGVVRNLRILRDPEKAATITLTAPELRAMIDKQKPQFDQIISELNRLTNAGRILNEVVKKIDGIPSDLHVVDEKYQELMSFVGDYQSLFQELIHASDEDMSAVLQKIRELYSKVTKSNGISSAITAMPDDLKKGRVFMKKIGEEIELSSTDWAEERQLSRVFVLIAMDLANATISLLESVDVRNDIQLTDTDV